MRRSQYREAIAQIKLEKEKTLAAGEEWAEEETPGKNSIEFVDAVEAKNVAVERRREDKAQKIKLRRDARDSRYEKIKEENISNTWYFEAGDLVVIKAHTRSSGKRWPHNKKAGTIGMIIETKHGLRSGIDDKNSSLVVMTEGEIQTWSAKWVKHCE
tara:strand:+ start:10601 stop:11071 length:471 start_codon:yes stop_codon:yes gene_type:complete